MSSSCDWVDCEVRRESPWYLHRGLMSGTFVSLLVASLAAWCLAVAAAFFATQSQLDDIFFLLRLVALLMWYAYDIIVTSSRFRWTLTSSDARFTPLVLPSGDYKYYAPGFLELDSGTLSDLGCNISFDGARPPPKDSCALFGIPIGATFAEQPRETMLVNEAVEATVLQYSLGACLIAYCLGMAQVCFMVLQESRYRSYGSVLAARVRRVLKLAMWRPIEGCREGGQLAKTAGKRLR
eukprot:CAMPEP_0174925696 /NCGR_PEP_ID=MMETSP1355-20121228/8088_1 /TAXON_ID=464990 /ORGANISM="Hemiselmis tepida, Strain CCMP443" /LENGTH=237 /DNA_ID=CAMNT_0016171645 /DNA_START=1 /DNA_END=711 /DNA_ORIENTATION=+